MRTFILFVLISIYFFSFSQKRNAVYCLPYNSMIQFTQDTFSLKFSNLNSFDTISTIDTLFFSNYFSTIGDTSGNLLFYTNGLKLWDKNHSLITDNLKGYSRYNLGFVPSGTPSYFIPIDDKIYLFNYNIDTTSRILYYSIFNKNGTIIKINEIIDSTNLYYTKFMGSIKTCNARDYFLYFYPESNNTIQPKKYLLMNDSLYFMERETNIYDTLISFSTYGNAILSNHFHKKGKYSLEVYTNDSSFILLQYDRKTGSRKVKKKLDLNNVNTYLKNQIENLYNITLKSISIGNPIFLDTSNFILFQGQFSYNCPSLGNSYITANISFITKYDFIRDTIIDYKILGVVFDDCGFWIVTGFNLTFLNYNKQVVAFPHVLSSLVDFFYYIKDYDNLTIDTIKFVSDIRDTSSTFSQNDQVVYHLRPEMEIGFKHQTLACTDTCYGGQRIAFTDTSCCHFYRLWDFGDGTKSDTLWVTQHADLLNKVDTFKTVTHTYTRPGKYKVTLQILNPYDYGEHLPPGQFLKDTLEKWIEVPFCSKAEFTAQSTCNQMVTILDKHCGAYDSLLYDYGDGSPITSSPTHTYAHPGVYYVTQILKLDTFISTFTHQVIVPDCIEPDVSLNDTLCVFDTLKITYTGTNNYDTLWYSIEPIQGVQNIQQNLVNFEQSGLYRLWLHAANATFDTTWIYPSTIVVLDCDELWIPNAFTPNRDGLNDVFNYVCRNCIWHNLEIFNRDAQPIFRCEGSEPCIWLGRTEKGAVPEGVYVYRLKVRKRDGREVERVGTVTVMR